MPLLVACTSQDSLVLDEREQALCTQLQEIKPETKDLTVFTVDWSNRMAVVNTDWMTVDLQAQNDTLLSAGIEGQNLEQVAQLKDERYRALPNAFGYLITYQTKDMPFANNMVAVFSSDSTQMSIEPVDYTDENHSVYYAGAQKNTYKTLLKTLRKLQTPPQP